MMRVLLTSKLDAAPQRQAALFAGAILFLFHGTPQDFQQKTQEPLEADGADVRVSNGEWQFTGGKSRFLMVRMPPSAMLEWARKGCDAERATRF
jgi:hypothetical protein